MGPLVSRDMGLRREHERLYFDVRQTFLKKTLAVFYKGQLAIGSIW